MSERKNRERFKDFSQSWNPIKHPTFVIEGWSFDKLKIALCYLDAMSFGYKGGL